MAIKDTTIAFDVAASFRSVWQVVRGNHKLLIGLMVLSPLVFSALFAPYIVPHDPTEAHVTEQFDGLGGEYPLGTDHLGRDLLSRVIMGARTSLLLGAGAVAIAASFGSFLGMTAGYMKGPVDELIMRTMDMIISFPALLMGLLVLSFLTSNLTNLILVVGFVYIPRFARVVRSATLSVSNQEFVQAAKVRGESHGYILFREILPNVVPPLVVESSVRFGYAIFIGTGLSFLGLGTQPPNADWGYMIAIARQYIYQTPWFLLWPSIGLSLTIFSTNLLGDGLKEALDVESADS